MVAPLHANQSTPRTGRRVSRISPEQGKREAVQVGDFFRRYPSRAANQISFFHALWAQQHKFDNPLRAYLYHTTRPVDDAGRPRNALWQAYVDTVRTGASSATVERAFLAAHIQDFKDVVKTPEYRELYAAASEDYKKVVEAYLDTLRQFESDLAAGRDPDQIARWMTLETAEWLSRWEARNNGLEVSLVGARNLADPTQPATRQFWRALWDIGLGFVFDAKPERPAPSAVHLRLTDFEARRLAAMTRIPFKGGNHELTPEMLAGASVAEPDRRPETRRAGPLKRYPLLMEDFLAGQKLRPGVPMAGPDGTMSADEVFGVLRNVQAKARSQLVQDFFTKYPVPEAGILLYSANMLAMNGTYGETQMFGTLANAIMPVDNDGKPKNALWQAYKDSYDLHKATGQPSMQELERLWFRAHMKDFEVVDTPAFQRQLALFWNQAAQDKAMAPMAVYTKAMVGGRKIFEEASREHLSDEAAFSRSFAHFARTVASSGSFPFWKEDLKEAAGWLKNRGKPELDSRGLPTDAAMAARAAQGIRMMGGLTRIMADGAKQIWAGATDRRPLPGSMVDLAQVLTPEELSKVDPKVVAFYKDPRHFDVRVGVEYRNAFSRFVLGRLDGFLSCMGQIPDRAKGFEGFPLEMDVYQDAKGGTHWDRYVVVDGKRQTLFPAKFEVEGKQIVETFRLYGRDVRLVFDVTPKDGGIQLKIDRKKSSFVMDSDITFTTTPTADGGVRTLGVYNCSFGLVNGTAEFRMRPKASATLANR